MRFRFLQVTFEGVVGTDAFSDIAIDDVEFQENTVCAKTAETLGKVLQLTTNVIQHRADTNKRKQHFRHLLTFSF